MSVPLDDSVGLFSLARGCLMDNKKHLVWEANDVAPTVLALMAAICLWRFVASAAMIYSSALGTG